MVGKWTCADLAIISKQMEAETDDSTMDWVSIG